MYDTGTFERHQAAPPPAGSDPFGALWRWRFAIAGLAVLGAAGGYGASHLIPPRFSSTAQIYVDPRGLHVFDNELTPRQQDSNSAVTFVESQARIITSQSVLARVVESERLTDDPEFNETGRSWATGLLSSLGLGRRAAQDPAVVERRAFANLYDRVIVRRPERTFVIEVTVRANDADKAARLANAVSQAYIDSQTAARANQARRASQSLTERLDELRARVRSAEERAESFRRENGLIGTRTQLVSEQQLTDANTQLAQAQTKVAEAEARHAQILVALRSGSPSALPEAVVSTTVAGLRGQQAEARRRLADASTEYGPRHPTVRNAQAQVADLDRAIGEELGRIAQSARADLDRARAAEATQRRTVQALTARASDAGQASVQLREFQREADVNRNLLNAFLARARETSELERVDTSSSRMITVAQPPRDRSFPPRGVIMAAAGGLAGGGLGGGLVVLFSLLGGTSPRRPDKAAPAPRRPSAQLVA